MKEVGSRLEAIQQGQSIYRTFAELSSIFHEFGNRLASLIYGESPAKEDQHLACVAGCSVCCHVPSEVRERDKRNFSMSYLDMVWLVENYEAIKAANPSLNSKVVAAAGEARRTGTFQPCPHLTTNGICGDYEHRPLPCKIWFSADVTLCGRNRELGYRAGVNPLTDLSRPVGVAFAQPFADCVQRIDRHLDFWGHDFLVVFEEIAKLDERGLFGALREKIDAGEMASWQPFLDRFSMRRICAIIAAH